MLEKTPRDPCPNRRARAAFGLLLSVSVISCRAPSPGPDGADATTSGFHLADAVFRHPTLGALQLTVDRRIDLPTRGVASATAPPVGWEFRCWERGPASADSGGEGSRAFSLAQAQGISERAPERRLFVEVSSETARWLVARLEQPRTATEIELIALAGLLSFEWIEPAVRLAAREAILERLREPGEHRELAAATLSIVSGFSGPEIATLAGSGDIVVRLLPLTHRAGTGSRDALEEILVLSLEYHSDAAYFAAAVETLLPRADNPRLYAAGPPGEDRLSQRAFLRGARQAAASARFLGAGSDGKGRWTLEPGESEP